MLNFVLLDCVVLHILNIYNVLWSCYTAIIYSGPGNWRPPFNLVISCPHACPKQPPKVSLN